MSEPDIGETMCFVAFRPGCGHMVFAAVDEPDRAAENAKEVARCIRLGLRVEKMPVTEVRAANWCPGDCPSRVQKKKSSTQDVLF